MDKRIVVEVQELIEFDSAGRQTWINSDQTRLFESECHYFCKNHMITNDELMDALDVLASWFVQSKGNKILLNVSERNNSLSPAKEMTMEELEKELGYKVKIVKEKENEQ